MKENQFFFCIQNLNKLNVNESIQLFFFAQTFTFSMTNTFVHKKKHIHYFDVRKHMKTKNSFFKKQSIQS